MTDRKNVMIFNLMANSAQGIGKLYIAYTVKIKKKIL